MAILHVHRWLLQRERLALHVNLNLLPYFGGATFSFFLTMNETNKYLRIIVGCIFMLSGLLKSLNTAGFANLMSQYGAEWFGFAAPILILIEIVLGFLLIFDYQPRKISSITIGFIIFVSTVYLYGLVVRDITDCGCFGPVTWLNSKPWLTFTRNALLIVLLISSIIRPQQGTCLSSSSLICLTGMGCIVMFMSGYSIRGAKCLQKHSHFAPIPLKEDSLANIITCDPDSSYLVVAFSYRCPYCQNSIGNINQYLSMGVVDRVIGIAATDSIGRDRFDRLFDVNFEILEVEKSELTSITHNLPTTYLIRHDSIVNKYIGMVSSPALSMP